VSLSIDGEWSRLAPLRILSFGTARAGPHGGASHAPLLTSAVSPAPPPDAALDIECAGRKGFFPEPDKDPVIQIANMVTVHGESKPCIRNIFTLKSCAHIAGADVHSFETEEEMLLAWRDFVIAVRPRRAGQRTGRVGRPLTVPCRPPRAASTVS